MLSEPEATGDDAYIPINACTRGPERSMASCTARGFSRPALVWICRYPRSRVDWRIPKSVGQIDEQV